MANKKEIQDRLAEEAAQKAAGIMRVQRVPGDQASEALAAAAGPASNVTPPHRLGRKLSKPRPAVPAPNKPASE